MSPDQLLSEKEFDELDHFLMSDRCGDDTMTMDALHGYLTAIALGPLKVEQAEWLPRVWGTEAEDRPDFKSEAEFAHISDMIERARAAGKPILIDPKGSDYARYQNATVITPNRSEMQEVVGPWSSEEELRTKAHALRTRLHLDAVLVTRSEEGMTLFDAEGELHVSAQA